MGSIANAIVQGGKVPNISFTGQIETVANCYPGRLVITGTGDNDLIVAIAGSNPVGWLGYEQASPTEKPATMTTIYKVDNVPPVLYGGGFTVLATLATSQTIVKGDALVPGAAGMVIKASALGIDAGAVAMKGSAEGGVISGSVGDERVIGYADESVTTTSAAKTIKVRSAI